MASHSVTRAKTATLSGTTADTITLTQGWPAVAITNHDVSDVVYFRMDGTTAVAAADNATPVLAGSSVIRMATINASNQITVSIVGDGGTYTVEGVN